MCSPHSGEAWGEGGLIEGEKDWGDVKGAVCGFYTS
jgi:hypothetical protein